jgi:hypothetical protein
LKVAIVQSNYIPWRGYFDLIASVDKFVVYDDVQYSKGSWRNRNRIKGPNGLRWLTVPVQARLGMTIDEVRISDVGRSWREAHRRVLNESLAAAPHFDDAIGLWMEAVFAGDEHLSKLNVRLIHGVCEYLGIDTPILMSRDFSLSGSKTERLLQLLKLLGADFYLSGPSARTYLDVSLLNMHGISVQYKSYDYPPYPQLWGEFEGGVSILDLVANTGRAARTYITSRSPNISALG